ncbi:heterokaryon incompatibility protein-domain-containing protein [Apiosordaria backusii]|uniref:Heterokaryon incompatibility protein-domain-containing protein n=1 Tax=Apiosordaria backusii TaxID=314023 RepID=A0AA40B2L4_9PEZI|nr:heterokaryon incompatibility protein-domain-containing protein [Apiosordaria backusii]
MSFKIYGQDAAGDSSPRPSALPTTTQKTTRPTSHSFQYQELESLPSAVRMLRVHPFISSPDEPLKADLVHTRLGAENHNFIALSYCWGNSPTERPISLNGETFFITESLWSALMSLRPRPGEEPIMTWADAVCINQQNLPERNRQVQRMTEIYGQAEYVAVHLGPETDSTALALTQLQALADSQDSIASMIANTTKQDDLHHRWQALIDFLALDYWHRLWIVQEIMLARSAVIYCGSQVIPWATYRDAIAGLTRHSELLLKFHSIDEYPVPRMNRTWYGIIAAHMESQLDPKGSNNRSSSTTDFLSLMESHRYRKCVEPKDKIYGMLGLVSAEQRQLVTVDYAASLTEVFTSFVGSVIQNTQRLDIICFTRHSPVYERPDRLPTWVPDWAYQRETLPIRASAAVRFDASRGRRAESGITGAGFKLSFRGVRMDTIGLCSVTCSLPWNGGGLLLALASAWMMARGALGNETDTAERFCEAVFFGSGRKQFGAEHVGRMFQTFRDYQQMMMDSSFLPLDSGVFSTTVTAVDQSVDKATSRAIWSLAGNCLAGRRAFVTRQQALLGVGSGYLGNNDVVCVPLGCDTPVVLRALGNGEYRFVGDAYVCGYMGGRAMSELDERQKELEEFVVV